jgi:tRNA(adenine34) deaminase
MGLKCKGLSGNLYFWPWNVAHPDGVFPGILLEERKIGIMTNRDDEWFMRRALEMAEKSSGRNEVPVGAVLVDEAGNILAAAGNSTVSSHDPAGHAEIRVLRLAAGRLANYRLPGTTMYVTLEPCAMCAAAMVHARIRRLVYGAADPKTGAVVSKYRIGSDGLLNHVLLVTGGVLAAECGHVLKNFFQKRR